MLFFTHKSILPTLYVYLSCSRKLKDGIISTRSGVVSHHVGSGYQTKSSERSQVLLPLNHLSSPQYEIISIPNTVRLKVWI